MWLLILEKPRRQIFKTLKLEVEKKLLKFVIKVLTNPWPTNIYSETHYQTLTAIFC